MFRILAILKIKDFAKFELFECQAAAIMAEYGGSITNAFETQRNPDGTGEEIHLVEFTDQESFQKYTTDSRLIDLNALRKLAIESTEIKASLTVKYYS